MDTAGTLINAGVVAAVGLILGWLGKGRFEAIERRFEGFEPRFEDLGHRIDRVESSLREELGAIRGEMNGLRSDLTAVALAVGAQPRAQNG
jgi:hypothetical protein